MGWGRLQQGQQLPLDPLGLERWLILRSKQLSELTSASCLFTARAFKGVLQLLPRSQAASELEINAVKPHKSVKISRSQSKDPSFTTWMFEPRFFSVI